MAATHLGHGYVSLPLWAGALSSGEIGGEEAEADVELGQAPEVTTSPMPRLSIDIACEPTPRRVTRLIHSAKPLHASAAVDVPIDERLPVKISDRTRAR